MTDRAHHPDPFRQGLEEWDGSYPEAWTPKPGELLVGRVVRYERGSTSYGDADIAVVHDEDSGEERSCWLLHEVLRREFAQKRPRIGERVGLKRLEDGQNQYGQRYQKWALMVDRDASTEPEFLNEPAPPGAEAPELHPDELAQRAADLRGEMEEPDDDLPF